MGDTVREMRVLAKQLMPYSFPQVLPQEEDAVACLKQREINVDGYDVIVYLSRCQHLEIEIETVHVFGKYFTYLPFHLVCKIVYQFLGGKELFFVEVMHCPYSSGVDEYCRKMYVWTVYYRDGVPISNPFVADLREFNYYGLKYCRS